MKKIIVIVLLLLTAALYAQSAEEFRKAAINRYYSYTNLGVKSLEFKVSSPELVEFLKKNGSASGFYLLKAKMNFRGEIDFSKNLDTTVFSGKIKELLGDYLGRMEKQFRSMGTELDLFLFNTPLIDILPAARAPGTWDPRI